MHAIWNNLRYALRGLRRQPGFALLAVLTLAVGIGPTVAVYAVFRQVLLRELPVPAPEQLVLPQAHSGYETGWLSTHGGSSDGYFAYPALAVLRRAEPRLAAIVPFSVTATGHGIAERVNAELVTGNYFSLMEARPLLGRLITDADDHPHAGQAVAVLNETFWRTSLGANSGVLNQALTLNSHNFLIIGVVGHNGLLDGRTASLFAPIAMHQAVGVGHADTLEDPFSRFLLLVGRVPAPERQVSLARLQTAWTTWRRDVLATHAGHIRDKAGWMRTSFTLQDGRRGVSILAEDVGTPVKLLQAMAALLLLVACANLANLLLARALRRESELATRLALGARPRNLLGAALAESALLALGGLALGLPLGFACLKLLAGSIAANSMVGKALHAPWNGEVLAAAVLIALTTALVFSCVPVALAARMRPEKVLHRGSGTNLGKAPLQGLLVSGTLALGLLLLLAATLLDWNLYRQSTADVGFRKENLLTFRLNASDLGMQPAAAFDLYSRALGEMSARPEMHSGAFAMEGLLTGHESDSNMTLEGRPNQPADPNPIRDYVSAGFFQTVGIPIIAGRDFSEDDRDGAEPVAIANASFVRVFFEGNIARALGAHLGFGASTGMTYPVRIIGVVPAIHSQSTTGPADPPSLYLSYAQGVGPHAYDPPNYFSATFYLRGSGTALAQDVRAVMHRLDSRLPALDLVTMQQQIDADIADTRVLALLSSTMGALAGLLAAIGLYGVLSYQVAARTREIGLRIAVGASRARVVQLVLRQTLRLSLGGMLAGGLLACGAARLLHTQTADFLPAPLWLYAAAALLLLVSAIAASLIPATRAAHIDPMEALRSE